MKNMFSIIALSFLLYSSISAQSEWNYGIKLGVSSSDFKVEFKERVWYEPAFEKNSVNPYLAFFINKNLVPNLALETELSYIQKGYRKTEEVMSTDAAGNETGNTKYTYGIDARYLGLGFNLKPVLDIGKITGFVIAGASINYNILLTNLSQNENKDITFSYNLGFGADIQKFINYPLFLEFKYSEDFSDFYSSDYYNLTNRLFIFNVGLKL